MYLQRITFLTKPGCLDEAVALIKNAITQAQVDGQVLVPVYGKFDQAVAEFWFDSLAQIEQFWSAWDQSAQADEFNQAYIPLYVPGGSNELWKVEESRADHKQGRLVNRRSFRAKAGKMEDIIQLFKSVQYSTARFDVTTASYGPNDSIAMQMYFKDMQEYEQGWVEWGATDEAAGFFQKWPELIEQGGENELLEIK